ncbi:host specificity protein J [Escherichia coli ECC-1470]|nr:host specificity protein J [Escherichia coli ECC-1470]
MLAVNSQTRTLTLDREITLPSSGTTLISLVDGSGNPVSVEVQSVTDGVKVKVSRVPDGVAGYSVWGLKLPTLRQRLFRCVSIRENETARMPSPPCSMYRKKKPSWITGRTLTATRAAR